jgi:molybdate-binding protein
VADGMGLDFTPLAEELYDFLVEKRLRNPYVRRFFDVLSSKRFQNQVETSTSGISFLKETGQVVLG